MNQNKRKFEHVSRDYKEVKEYKVKKPCTLLDFLFETFPDKSRNATKSLLSSRKVSIDGAPVTQFDFALTPGDTILISKTPIHKKTRSNLPILFENEEMIVINKPSGLLSIPSDKEKGSTAFRMVNDYEQQKDKHNRVYIVHRIDEDTSGVLLMVKNAKLQDALMSKWNDLVNKRGYYAIVEGKMKEKSGTITSYLKKNKQNMMYSSKVKGDGQYSVTHYRVLAENDQYSLLDVHIDSGRKNQIRVHLGDLGHHVIGDDKYGNPSNPIKRLGLHAYCLELTHPFTKKTLKFVAPMPKEFLSLFPNYHHQENEKK